MSSGFRLFLGLVVKVHGGRRRIALEPVGDRLGGRHRMSLLPPRLEVEIGRPAPEYEEADDHDAAHQAE